MDRPPAPPDDGGDPALYPVRVLVEDHLARASSAWTLGAPGAVAWFARDPEEPAQRGPNSVVTARGGVRLVLPDDAVAVAYETPSGRDPLRWHQTVAFCVPDAAARRAGRRVVTELGPDTEALRPHDLAGVLFDLGLGTPSADVLVRTADPDGHAALAAMVGRDPLDPDVGLATALASAALHVVVLTAAGRLEVLGPSSRRGPQLRLRPERARTAPAVRANVPVPAGWTPVVRLHPAHPTGGLDGPPIAFDPERHAAFQALLDEYGDPVLGAVTAQVTDAVRALRGPETLALATDPVTRAAVAVVLRRLALTDGTSGTLTAWRSRFGPAPGDAEE